MSFNSDSDIEKQSREVINALKELCQIYRTIRFSRFHAPTEYRGCKSWQVRWIRFRKAEIPIFEKFCGFSAFLKTKYHHHRYFKHTKKGVVRKVVVYVWKKNA